VDGFAGRNGALDGAEEADEFQMTIALPVAADHLAVEQLSAAKRVVAPWR
jgi:GH18 family chitinase